MDKNQKDIYYIAADTKSQALSSPHLEGFKSKGIKVLVMADPIDQFWLSMAGQFKEKNFVSITQGEIDLDNIKSDKKDPKNKDSKKEKKGLAAFLKGKKFTDTLPGKKQINIFGSIVIGLNMILVLLVILYLKNQEFHDFIFNVGR